MNFCANPKCMFHVDVPWRKNVHTVVFPEPVKNLSESVSTHVSIITREKHLWRDDKGTEWFFCDVCNEAAKMVAK